MHRITMNRKYYYKNHLNKNINYKFIITMEVRLYRHSLRREGDRHVDERVCSDLPLREVDFEHLS